MVIKYGLLCVPIFLAYDPVKRLSQRHTVYIALEHTSIRPGSEVVFIQLMEFLCDR